MSKITPFWTCLTLFVLHFHTSFASPSDSIIDSIASPMDSIIVKINRQEFHPGDTLDFVCQVPGFIKDSIVGTMNVVIENLHSNRRWQYRYPVLNGEAVGSLVIGDAIGDGNYAVNFVVEKRFFRLEGQVKGFKPRLSPLTYIMMAKDKASYLDNVTPEADGSFRLRPMYFADTAYFVFSPPKKYQTDHLWIDVQTQLDSAFIPYAVNTSLITVAAPGITLPKANLSDYHFLPGRPSGPGVLADVVVSGRQKKMVDRFNEDFSTGLFKGREYMIFDGLESDQIAKSFSVYDFLKWQLPGFTAKTNNEGEYILRWRNAGVIIYLDEFPLTHPNDYYVDPSEVAMIKTYAPPSFLGNRNGVIAIYTKRGVYELNPDRKSKFRIAGFTAQVARWN